MLLTVDRITLVVLALLPLGASAFAKTCMVAPLGGAQDDTDQVRVMFRVEKGLQ